MDPSICFLTPAGREDNRGLMERRLEARRGKRKVTVIYLRKFFHIGMGLGAVEQGFLLEADLESCIVEFFNSIGAGKCCIKATFFLSVTALL